MNRRIPFLDLGAAHAELADEIGPVVQHVAAGGRYILGEEVAAFEAEFAAHVGARYCVAVANGLDALRLVLQAWGIGPGDEVIVPANTYIATLFAVSGVGARPVPIDPDETTHVIDADRAEAAVTARTRAIIPVHLYGYPAPIAGLRQVADRHGLHLLEDAAQAHGARHVDGPVGTGGEAAAWSFYPVKNLGALGDGGAVTTDDEALARRLRLVRNHGSVRRGEHEVVGTNSRLDELQAAILRVKLRRLDEWNDRRRTLAARYLAGLAETGLVLPPSGGGLAPAWHLFVVQSPARDALQAALAADGIETLIHYPVPPHLQPAYADLGLRPGSLPVTERLATEILSLPIGPHLAAVDADRVIGAVRHHALARSGAA
jgi:dTDP-4-amino-4,6-dideoxygalactose transaminase